MRTQSAVLSVRDFCMRFSTADGEISAVNHLSFDVYAGEALGVVGESGSGKSQTFLGMLGLAAKNGRASGSANLAGIELINASSKTLQQLRGRDVAMIFQDPMTSLNPYLRISTQMIEVLKHHQGLSQRAATQRCLQMLDTVQIPDAKRRFRLYPHEFSGGMRQRVMIAMALLCDPKLIIADEPTTALDVTVQAEILALLNQLKTEMGTAIVLITHDLGVVAGLCDRVQVMYAGRIIERSNTMDLFSNAQHPYTAGLLRSTPRLDKVGGKLDTISGQPPNIQHLPSGCAFHPRCPKVLSHCAAERPDLIPTTDAHHVACFAAQELQ